MGMKTSRDRGRPRGSHHGIADFTALDYINRISMKHDLDLNTFFSSFVEAWQCQESKCESLLIECREKTRDYSVFLITKGFNVVAQFHIPNHILQETDPLKNFIAKKKLHPKMMAKVNVEPLSIRELKIGMKHIKLTGKVTEISKSNTVFSRFGEAKQVANAKLTDETGFIQLPLWNQQIQTVAPGDLIQLENAYVGSFRGKRQLRIRGSRQLKVIKKGETIKQPKKEEDS
jgi:hypothetical protein